jgi:hypothetical protein
VVAALSVQFFSLPAEVRRDAKAHSGIRHEPGKPDRDWASDSCGPSALQ